MNEYPHLLSPLKVKSTIFKNRIFSAPNLIPHVGVNGMPTDYLIAYYEEKARGGAAQVTVGETPIDEEHASSHKGQLAINKESISLLREIALGIKIHGAIPSIELGHCGAGYSMKALVMQDEIPRDFHPIGPVQFIREKDGATVTAMDRQMMEHVADNFANAAAMVKLAGFEMCLIHAGHGWLLSQFLSPLSNTREDEFGGSFENRLRFPSMVLDRIRQRVGEDFLIELRVSGEEGLEGGLTLDDTVRICRALQSKVDLIHVSAGNVTCAKGATRTHPTVFLPHGVNVPFAEKIKAQVDIPVIVVGAINTPEQAESILAAGQADVISMARALIADPDFPNKAAGGRRAEIRPCIRCLDCLTGIHSGSQFNCAVNPICGREFHMKQSLQPRPEARTVLVAGGGPAGMVAAIAAAGRGHRVTLAEQSGQLGGLITHLRGDPLKSDLCSYVDYLINKVVCGPVTVRLGEKVTAEYIRHMDPDYVIAAIGAEVIVPKIKGVENIPTVNVLDVFSGKAELGESVAVVGGGLAGCEAAVFLAQKGHRVTVIHSREKIAQKANWMNKVDLLDALDRWNVRCIVKHRCTEIGEGYVRLTGQDGGESFLPADSVVLATGMRARQEQAEELWTESPGFVSVGDCVHAGNIGQAVHEAFFAAMAIV